MRHFQRFSFALHQRQRGITRFVLRTSALLSSHREPPLSVDLYGDAFQRFLAGSFRFARCGGLRRQLGFGSQRCLMSSCDTCPSRLQGLRFPLRALLRLVCGFGIQRATFVCELGGLIFHRHTHARNGYGALFGLNALLRLADFAAIDLGPRTRAFAALNFLVDAVLQGFQRRSLRIGS